MKEARSRISRVSMTMEFSEGFTCDGGASGSMIFAKAGLPAVVMRVSAIVAKQPAVLKDFKMFVLILKLLIRPRSEWQKPEFLERLYLTKITTETMGRMLAEITRGDNRKRQSLAFENERFFRQSKLYSSIEGSQYSVTNTQISFVIPFK